MNSSAHRARKGFTLIELLLVVGIIAILASIVIVVMNPGKQMGSARDTQRRTDVTKVLNAVYDYAIDHDGALPKGIEKTRKEICATGSTCKGLTVDLDILTGSYITTMPHDPLTPTTATGTNYFIMEDANGQITVDAPAAEETTSISAVR